jgi:hypothetical protein
MLTRILEWEATPHEHESVFVTAQVTAAAQQAVEELPGVEVVGSYGYTDDDGAGRRGLRVTGSVEDVEKAGRRVERVLLRDVQVALDPPWDPALNPPEPLRTRVWWFVRRLADRVHPVSPV